MKGVLHQSCICEREHEESAYIHRKKNNCWGHFTSECSVLTQDQLGTLDSQKVGRHSHPTHKHKHTHYPYTATVLDVRVLQQQPGAELSSTLSENERLMNRAKWGYVSPHHH